MKAAIILTEGEANATLYIELCKKISNAKVIDRLEYFLEQLKT